MWEMDAFDSDLITTRSRQQPGDSCPSRFSGRFVQVACDKRSGLYKQRLGDFFAPKNL